MNTSVVNSNLTVSVDWLSFTVTDLGYNVNKVIEFLGFDLSFFHDTGHGAMGYKSLLKLGDYAVSVLSDGREDMGIHVQIGGSAINHVLHKFFYRDKQPFSDDLCADMDEINMGAVKLFCQRVLEIGHFKRIDLALDDKQVYFTPSDLREYSRGGHIVSKFRSGRLVEGFDVSSGKTDASTFYLGSRQSECFLRVYDKQAEHNMKHPDDIVDAPWIRWEFQFNDKRANLLAEEIADLNCELGFLFFAILNNYIRLINHDDSNRSRCSLMAKWAEFIVCIECLSLYCPPMEKTLDDKKNWIIQQVLPTLTGIIIADGGSYDIILSHWEDSLRRMSPGMQNLVHRSLI